MRRIVISGLLLALACGGGVETDVRTRSGPTQFSGVSAQFQHHQASLEGQPVQILSLGLYEIPLWCSATDAGTPPNSVTALVLEVIRFGANPVGPGTYELSRPTGEPKEAATGVYYRVITLDPSVALDVVSGTLSVSRADSAAAEGRVDLVLEDGTRIEGEFSAIDCIQ